MGRWGGARSSARAVVLAMITFALAGCAEPAPTAMNATASTATPVAPTRPHSATMMDDPSPPATAPAGAQPRLAADPAQLADDLVADEKRCVTVDGGGRAGGGGAPPAGGLPRHRASPRMGRDHPPANPAVTTQRLRPQCRRPSAAHRDDTTPKARCPRGASGRRLRRTSCSATTTTRSRRPASAGTTWPRST